MPDKDIVLAKVATIQRCLDRIRDVTDLDPESLEDIDKQDIFVLNLQRAIQACIDLAAHAVASEHLGFPESIRDNFVILKERGVIGAELASRMLKMTGFRNVAVYNYQALDLNILKSILVNNLKDIEEFYSTLLQYWHF
ncbi:MAG: DUF86 domain-containing protein [Acetomicrobium sp.]